MQLLASYPVRHIVALHRNESHDAVYQLLRRHREQISESEHSPLAIGFGRLSLDNYGLSVYVDAEIAEEFQANLQAATLKDAPYTQKELAKLTKANPRFFGQVPVEGAIAD